MDRSSSKKQTGRDPTRPFTIILTNTSKFSDASRTVARAHAMTWSRRRARERKASIEAEALQKIVVEPPSPPHSPGFVASILDVSLIDPFETTAVPIDRDMSFLLKLFNDHVLPGYWPFKSWIDTMNRYWISMALHDAVALNAIAMRTTAEIEGKIRTIPDEAQFSCAHVSGRTGNTSKFNCAYFKAKTIQHLNERLQEKDLSAAPAAPANIYAVLLLLLLEISSGDTESVKTHLSGLRSLVTAGGGLHKYPQQLIQPVMMASILGSIIVQVQPPFYARTVEDSLSRSTIFILENCSDPLLNQLGRGLLASSTADVLSPRLRHLFYEYRRTIIFRELNRMKILKPTNMELMNILNTLSSIKYSIVSLMFGAESSLLTPHQATICYTILISEINGISLMPRQSYSYALMHQFKAALQQTTGSWTSHTATVIWILYIGAFSSKGEKERAWFVEELAGVIHSAGIWTLEELEGILHQFFYLDRVHGQSLPEIWHETSVLRVPGFLDNTTIYSPFDGSALITPPLEDQEALFGNYEFQRTY